MPNNGNEPCPNYVNLVEYVRYGRQAGRYGGQWWRSGRLRVAHTALQSTRAHSVRSGSWPCENSEAAETCRRIFPQISIGEARLAPRRRVRPRSRTRFPSVHASFEFSHTQGQQEKKKDATIRVRRRSPFCLPLFTDGGNEGSNCHVPPHDGKRHPPPPIVARHHCQRACEIGRLTMLRASPTTAMSWASRRQENALVAVQRLPPRSTPLQRGDVMMLPVFSARRIVCCVVTRRMSDGSSGSISGMEWARSLLP